MPPDAALILGRFVYDGPAVLLWGAGGFLAVLVPQPLAARIGARLSPAFTVAAVFAVAAALATLPMRAAMLGDGWSDALDPTTLHGVLFETDLGPAWLVQLAAALVAAGAAFVPKRWRTATFALGGAAMLASLPLVGHAGMQQGGLGLIHRLNDGLHVLAGGFWLGALVPFVPLLARIDDPRDAAAANAALRRFSNIGHAAVALVVLTGIANAALILNGSPIDGASLYQRLLATKIALVAGMVGLAILNRYVFVPRVAARSHAVMAIRIGSLAEIALGIAVLALVAAFGMMDPAG